ARPVEVDEDRGAVVAQHVDGLVGALCAVDDDRHADLAGGADRAEDLLAVAGREEHGRGPAQRLERGVVHGARLAARVGLVGGPGAVVVLRVEVELLDVGEDAEQRARVAGEALAAEVDALRDGRADDQLAAAHAVAEDDHRGLAGEDAARAGAERGREAGAAPAGDALVAEVELVGGPEVGEGALPVLGAPGELFGADAAALPWRTAARA